VVSGTVYGMLELEDLGVPLLETGDGMWLRAGATAPIT